MCGLVWQVDMKLCTNFATANNVKNNYNNNAYDELNEENE